MPNRLLFTDNGCCTEVIATRKHNPGPAHPQAGGVLVALIAGRWTGSEPWHDGSAAAATLQGLAAKLNSRLDDQGMGDAGHYFTDDGTEPICMDCAQYGERTGHQECQYPEDHG
jgi:hypothetical protein